MSARARCAAPGDRGALCSWAPVFSTGDLRAWAAWREWLAGADDPVAAFAQSQKACRRLAPLLAGVATARFGGQLGAAVAASILREELRWQTLASDAAQILDALRAAGVDCVVSGGVSAAVTVYEKPWQRHCHDIDLVVGAALGAGCGDGVEGRPTPRAGDRLVRPLVRNARCPARHGATLAGARALGR